MENALQISFRGMAPSPALERRIREKAAKLERVHGRIMNCLVVVEACAHRRHRGKFYRVRINLHVPGRSIVVRSSEAGEAAHTDVHVALRDAFDAARRRLEDHARVARHDVKDHAVPPHGRISRLFRTAGYGFIEAADGREIYFRRNSVVNGAFKDLRIGSEVRFALAEGAGIDGIQATAVRPIGKHHLVS